MNTLSHGFLFLAGLSWLLGEVCVSAGAGFWTPVWLFLIGFTVMFAIMGCLPVSERTINLGGAISSLVIGGGIVLYGLGAFVDTGFFAGLIRLVGGGAMVVAGVVSLLQARGEKSSPAH